MKTLSDLFETHRKWRNSPSFDFPLKATHPELQGVPYIQPSASVPDGSWIGQCPDGSGFFVTAGLASDARWTIYSAPRKRLLAYVEYEKGGTYPDGSPRGSLLCFFEEGVDAGSGPSDYKEFVRMPHLDEPVTL